MSAGNVSFVAPLVLKGRIDIPAVKSMGIHGTLLVGSGVGNYLRTRSR